MGFGLGLATLPSQQLALNFFGGTRGRQSLQEKRTAVAGQIRKSKSVNPKSVNDQIRKCPNP